MTKRPLSVMCLLLILAVFGQTVLAQSTEFTYQGRLLSGGVPANGSHDFEFRLFRDSAGNELVGTPRRLTDVNVNNGVFSVRLDFGDEFPGENRYLEIRVRPTGQQFFSVLAPLQAITSTPYAIKSLNAENAINSVNSTNATQLGGVDAAQYVLTADSRMTDERTPLPNSPSYIQNSTTQQASSNFNVSGSGTVGGTLKGNIVNATTQYNIGTVRVLSAAGPITGTNANFAVSASNTFVGENTGLNSSPDPNTSSTVGKLNSFFGVNAGKSNSTGEANSFFGARAGEVSITGSGNAFFGHQTGVRNTDGAANSFFGKDAGFFNTTGGLNTFVGKSAGASNTIGESNSFFGSAAGFANIVGSNNTFVGHLANPGANNLTNATAIGAHARADQSNALVLGSINGVGGATADTRVGIGTTSPTAKLTISGNGAFNATSAARFDLFNTSANVGYFQHVLNDGRWQLGTGNQTRLLVDSAGNLGIGTGPVSKLTADGEVTSLGASGGRFAANNPNNQNARVLFDWINDGTTDWPRIRYGGSGAGSSNGFLIQGPGESTKLAVFDTGKVSIPQALSVGTTATIQLGNSGCTGTPGSIPGGAIGFNGVSCANYSIGGDGANTFVKAPSGAISFLVGGNEAIRVASTGRVSINLPGSGGSTTLCLNSSNQISFCSSSIRYKENILPFASGLNLIKRLRPVSFDWKDDKSFDFGLVAEEVADVEPLLVSRDRNGVIEGVKYDRLGVVLINAVQEQQQQIDDQKKEIQGQKDLILSQTTQIDDLKKEVQQQTDLVESLRRVLCESHHNKDVCRKGNDHD